MPQEIKKSYNPLKMWGSWIGLGVGVIGTTAYIISPYLNGIDPNNFTVVDILLNILIKLGGSLQMTNPITLILQWPVMSVVLMTPIFMFLYGWGIHSLFRKFSKKAYMSTSTTVFIVLVIIVIWGILS